MNTHADVAREIAHRKKRLAEIDESFDLLFDSPGPEPYAGYSDDVHQRLGEEMVELQHEIYQLEKFGRIE